MNHHRKKEKEEERDGKSMKVSQGRTKQRVTEFWSSRSRRLCCSPSTLEKYRSELLPVYLPLTVSIDVCLKKH